MAKTSNADDSDSPSVDTNLKSELYNLKSRTTVAEFVATGTARVLARAIEDWAQAQGPVTAVVVPWEGTATTMSMAVTSVRADGWAIEHTNLGTIVLTDLGNGTTAVALTADEPDLADKDRLLALFDRFARQLQRQFEAAS
jgi:hypothetical protein